MVEETKKVTPQYHCGTDRSCCSHNPFCSIIYYPGQPGEGTCGVC